MKPNEVCFSKANRTGAIDFYYIRIFPTIRIDDKYFVNAAKGSLVANSVPQAFEVDFLTDETDFKSALAKFNYQKELYKGARWHVAHETPQEIVNLFPSKFYSVRPVRPTLALIDTKQIWTEYIMELGSD